MASNLPKSMRAIRQTALGAAEALIFNPETPFPEAKPSHTLIKVHSAALNRADLLMRSGHYPHQNGRLINLGLEVAGEDVNSGKKVMALLAEGGYSEYVYVPNEQVMPVPESVTLQQAAAIPEVWLTAWQLLTFVAQQKPSESGDKYCLIHAGASGVGTAATQICKKILNLKVITTVGSDEKAEASRAYGADHTINYKTETNWSDKVLELTGGQGASVILDCVGGSYFEKNLDSLAVDGKWVLYGFLGGAKIAEASAIQAKFLPKILGKRGQLLASLLNARPPQYKADLVSDFSKNVLPFFESGQVKPVIDSTFDIQEVVQAHKYMEGNKNIGKILLKIDH